MTEQVQNGDGDGTKGKGDFVPVVNLLDDKPTNEDKTGDGHQRVADAIARLIEREQGGKAIALEGSWGSGKSSVVRMLEEACGDDTVVYTFDAWKHEADPLRIAFLRGLFERLKKRRSKPEHEPWIKPGHHRAWKKALDQFERGSGVTRNVHAALLRKKDLAAIWALLTAPIVLALGVAIFTSDLQDDIRYVVGGIALLFALIVASVPLWSFGKAKPTFPSTEHEEDPGSEHEPSVAQIMLTRQPAHVVTRFNGPPPVTSLSFERLFKLLVRRALQAEKDRRLVIVVDNLDRLSSEDALNVWSTMRVFLEMDQHASPWLDRFWLVVPYDRSALAELWSSDTKSTHQTANPGEPETTGNEGQKTPRIHHSRPSSFLDKTFAIRFDVPPLLLANWEAALGTYLKDALGQDLSEATIKSIARLSRRFASGQHHPPTPRHLKLFVNDIGALVRQHGLSFPLETLAAYAILRRAPLSPEGIREDLRNVRKDINKYLGAGWLDEDRSIDLACLVFNTHKKELARELLLVEPIGRAIGAGDRKILEGLLSNPAAESVLEDSVDGILEAVGHDDASNVEHGFEVLEAVLAEAEGHKAELLRALATHLYPNNNVLKNANNAPILCFRVARIATDAITLAKIVGHLREVAQDDESGVRGDELAKCWTNLWSQGGEAVRSDPGFREIMLPSHAGYAQHFLMELHNADGGEASLWSRLRAPDGLDLTKALLPTEAGDPWIEAQLDALTVVSYMPRSSIKWERIADAMHEYVSSAPQDDDEMCIAILRFMRGFESGSFVLNPMRKAYLGHQDSPFVKHRAALRDGGRCLELFASSFEAERWDDAANFLVEHGLSNAITPSTASSILFSGLRQKVDDFFHDPQTSPAVLDAIAAIDPPWLRPFLQQQLKEKESATLAAAVMDRMEPDALRACFHPARVIKDWGVLDKANRAAPGIIENVLDAHEVADIEHPYAISRKLVADQELEEHIGPIHALVQHGAGEQAFYKELQEFLANIESDFWAEDIAAKGDWYALLLTLQDKRPTTLGTNYYRGLEVLAAQLVQEPEKVQKIDAADARKLLDIVGETHALTLAKALRKLAAETVKNKRARLYEVFGEPIREAMLAARKPSDVPDILIPALDGSHGAEPAWVPGFLEHERAPGVVAVAEEADRRSLLSTVQEKAKAEGADGGPSTIFLDRCREIGLVSPEGSEEPEDESPA